MSCVYFLQARRQGSQRIKIGRTVICPFMRTGQIKGVFWQYRDYHLLGVIPTTAPVTKEREVKEKFRRWRERGEFFLPAPDLHQYIHRYAEIHICTPKCFLRTDEQLSEIETVENRREKRTSEAFERNTALNRSRYNAPERRIQQRQSVKHREKAQ